MNANLKVNGYKDSDRKDTIIKSVRKKVHFKIKKNETINVIFFNSLEHLMQWSSCLS